MNGDDELAKTLTGGLKFEETEPSEDHAGAPPIADPSSDSDDTAPSMTDMPKPSDDNTDHDDSAMPAPVQADADNNKDDSDHTASPASSDLDSIKSSALDDLKPLVGKLNLSAEEKFDTLLLIIRSTDDQGLLPEAHAAAKEISDDTKRAQALLDIIKEVDYFNGKK